MIHYFHTGSANPEWYKALRNIDDLDPDHNYVSGLRPKPELIESHKNEVSDEREISRTS